MKALRDNKPLLIFSATLLVSSLQGVDNCFVFRARRLTLAKNLTFTYLLTDLFRTQFCRPVDYASILHMMLPKHCSGTAITSMDPLRVIHQNYDLINRTNKIRVFRGVS